MTRWKYFVLLATAALAAGGGWHGADLARQWAEATAVEQWLAELDAAAPHQAPALCDRIAQTAVGGLVLARAADHPRADVRQRAASRLRELVRSWQDLPAAESGPRVARLARQLALPPQHADPLRDALLGPLVDLLLNWSVDPRACDAGQFLADCEQLAGRIRRLPPPAEAPARPQAEPQPELLVAAEDQPPTPILLAPDDRSEAPLLENWRPRRTAPLRVADDTPAEPEPELFAPVLPQVGGARELPAVAPEAPIPQASAEADARGRRMAQEALAGLADYDLMLRLHGDPHTALAAAQELQRRGFGPRELILARSLADPDPQVRLDLVEALPRLKGVDPVPWLERLRADRNAVVRSAAANVLKSSPR